MLDLDSILTFGCGRRAVVKGLRKSVNEQGKSRLLAVKMNRWDPIEQREQYLLTNQSFEQELEVYNHLAAASSVGKSDKVVDPSPFVLTILRSFNDDFEEKLRICMSPCFGGSLHDHIRHYRTLSLQLSQVYASQLVDAVQYLHSCRVVHRDIKSSNCLIDHRGALKLADFETSIILSDHESNLCILKGVTGTRHLNTSPEMMSGKGYGYNTDWWGVGVLIREMLTGQLPPALAKSDIVDKEKEVLLAEEAILRHESGSPPEEDNEADMIWRYIQFQSENELWDQVSNSHIDNSLLHSARSFVVHLLSIDSSRRNPNLLVSENCWLVDCRGNRDIIAFDERIGFMDFCDINDDENDLTITASSSLSLGQRKKSKELTQEEQDLFADF